MTALKERLKKLIANAGPLSISDYMASCLFDPESGYYTNRQPFGADGDFITAPEISQMFGELVAVWAYSTWVALGRPMPATLTEIGPGRGTLMVDMLRTLDRLDPSFVTRIRVSMVEASPRLTEIQQKKLGGTRARPTWFANVADLPDVPLLIVGNELFDAIPVRQFVKTVHGWRERMVTTDDNGELCFAIGASSLDPSLLPPEDVDEGTIVEVAPARSALMQDIASHIARNGGFGLFFDYGSLTSGYGDTLQAMQKHGYDDVLAHPGEADLTTHVDFDALARIAQSQGLATRMMTQGEFLLGMGILERAGVLGSRADETTRERLRSEVERLAGPEAMGELFKVLMIAPRGTNMLPAARAD